jgi:serine/threonine protein kinase
LSISWHFLRIRTVHYQGIIHRDIKPANLLWTKDKVVKISDFGVAHVMAPDGEEEGDRGKRDERVELAKTVGSPAFLAPELCRARGSYFNFFFFFLELIRCLCSWLI